MLQWVHRTAVNSMALRSWAGHTSWGTGVYRAASMLNHACDPALTLRWAQGTACLVARATRPLQRGQPATICYGPQVHAWALFIYFT